ncbi:hypothetical protein, partial [Enterococcus faecium]|uniref:hypothetical protein n=1 Tax=Enterococcus faecium TaxID=1352 RepID=UPI0039776B11
FAVLEIDEASLSKVTEYMKPELFLFTNIFRDQMDRYGEIYTTRIHERMPFYEIFDCFNRLTHAFFYQRLIFFAERTKHMLDYCF